MSFFISNAYIYIVLSCFCVCCVRSMLQNSGGGIFLCLISLLNFSFVVKVVYFYDPDMTINGIRLSCSLKHVCKFEYLYVYDMPLLVL